MRILIIRHADPDYDIDGLTEVGKTEADLLSLRLAKENISKIYCSPLGRAKLTAKPTAQKLGLDIECVPALREFDYAYLLHKDYHKDQCAWDLLPEFMNNNPDLYSQDKWMETEVIKNSEIASAYKEVCFQLDKILESHGYKREGLNYKVLNPNHDTIALFCHYGVASVLLSHIMNCSPYTFWQNGVLLPSSVTIAHTEERREGLASLRVCNIGDISHLYKEDKEPSFSARFCECFSDNTRHD